MNQKAEFPTASHVSKLTSQASGETFDHGTSNMVPFPTRTQIHFGNRNFTVINTVRGAMAIDPKRTP